MRSCSLIGSHARREGVFLIEVTPDKKIVWQSKHPATSAVHHFQILTSNGKPEPGTPMK